MSSSVQYVVSGDGTKIWAESAGDQSKPAVVLIHGFGCTALGFEKQFSDPVLLKSLHLIRYEMRGHGRSDKPITPEAYESIRFAQDFQAVCQAFGATRPFVLGWSLGGGIIVDIVDAYGAEFISGAIYCGGAVLTRPIHAAYSTPFLGELVPGLLSHDSNLMTKADIDFVHGCVQSPETVLPFETKIQWIGGVSVLSPTVRFLTLTREQNNVKWESEIRKLPVLIIQGDKDSMVEAEGLRAAAERVLPKYEMKVLEGIGHTPCYEAPLETREFILDFVRHNIVDAAR